MAHEQIMNSGMPHNLRGQGAVEAILTLPVFLILTGLIFQLFFLNMAKVQLQYAAYCAARAGVVHSGDKDLMIETVKKILDRSPGLLLPAANPYEVEIINSTNIEEGMMSGQELTASGILQVRVHWHFPLMVPLPWITATAGHLPHLGQKRTIHLQASWAMPMFGSLSKGNSDAKDGR